MEYADGVYLLDHFQCVGMQALSNQNAAFIIFDFSELVIEEEIIKKNCSFVLTV